MDLIYNNDFKKDIDNLEMEGKGRIYIENEKLYMETIDSYEGLTVWINKNITGNILIFFLIKNKIG